MKDRPKQDREDGEDPGMAALIRDARHGWNRPPETPKDEIWREISAALFDAGASEAEAAPVRSLEAHRGAREARARWGGGGRWLAAAAVAVLLLGVGIGRLSVTPPEGAPPALAGASGSTPAPSPALRVATAAHLTATETLLSVVRADARTGELDPAVGRWGRRLLTETRLLQDSRAITDPALRSLLDELEMILAQVALLADPDVDDARRREELELLADGLDAADVQTRLRATLPTLDATYGETD